MKRIMRRLKCRTGETLVESLVAILVFTFASIILLSMVSTSANINNTAKDTDAEIRSQLMGAETDPSTVNGTVTFHFGGTVTEPVSVDIGQSDIADALYAYYPSVSGGSGG